MMDGRWDELYDLAERSLGDDLTPAESDRLEALLREHPAARDAFIDYLHDSYSLAGWAGARLSAPAGPLPPSNAAPPAPAIPASASPVLGFLGDVGRQGWGFVSNHSLLFSVLLVLGLGTAWVIWRAEGVGRNEAHQIADLHPEISDPKSPPAPNPQSLIPNPSSSPVARLTRAANCRWNGSAAPQIGQPLAAGQSLNLAAGVAEIEFDVGAKVVLQGPAAFELLSDKIARLDVGKAAVKINNERARGFKILTSETTFVDQGTEFGVEVTPGGANRVYVFKGEVDVERNAKEGRAAGPTQRLVENSGARLESDEPGMTLVQDTGECFIRSILDADRDEHVVAYWRFEDRPVGILLPDTEGKRLRVCATVDSSFNGNDLYAGMARNRPMFSADVAAAAVAQSGRPNRSCLDTSRPTEEIHRLNVSTHSPFSHAAPLDAQRIAPERWTIEASVKAARLFGKAQGFLGRDGTFTLEESRAPARLTFEINARDRFAIAFYDADGRFHEAVAEDLPVEAGRWYHLAATSDGRVLRLYVDALDGRGYVERAATQLPADGSTALGKGKDNAEWSIGRAGNAGDPADWLRFWGFVDEIRISDVARAPGEFLFAPRERD